VRELVPDELTIKVGETVMVVVNTKDPQVVNGTIGTVVSFSDLGFPVIRLSNDPTIEKTITVQDWLEFMPGDFLCAGEKAIVSQLPLVQCDAITIHKGQGHTLPWVKLSLNGMFAPYHAYVAISRVPFLNQLSIDMAGGVRQIDPGIFKCDEKSRQFFKDCCLRSAEVIKKFLEERPDLNQTKICSPTTLVEKRKLEDIEAPTRPKKTVVVERKTKEPIKKKMKIDLSDMQDE